MLLLRVVRGQIVWAALDPWELRGLGRFHGASGVGLRLTLARVMLRVHPSALVLYAAEHLARLTRVLREGADQRGLPLLVPTLSERREVLAAVLPPAHLTEVLPELAHVRDRSLQHTASLAYAALSILTIPSRRYVPGLASSPASRMGSERAGRARSS